MNKSGIKTRNLILDNAIKLFTTKGFSSVTMSDFCESCQLSRGGLYRHFSSTGEIFEAMIMRSKDYYKEKLQSAMASGISAAIIIKDYFEYSEKEIIKGCGRLSLAAYEYIRADNSRASFATEKYNSSVDLMLNLVEYGISRNEFRKIDARAFAEHAVIFLDGIRIAAVFFVDQETITRQLNTLYSSLVIE